MNCILGITGSIASGKSLIRSIIARMGYPVFDADLEVKNLYKDVSIQKKVLQLFPNMSQIDKERISTIIYTNHSKRYDLNSIFHPIIREKLIRYISRNRGLIFAEIPLLYEANFQHFFNYVICAYAPEPIRLLRFKDRTKNPEAQLMFDLVNASQMSQEQKSMRSDFIAYTHSTDLNKQIKNIIQRVNNVRNCSGY